MATIREVLEKVSSLDTFSESIKCRWLGELDKRQYHYPEDADTELLSPNTAVYEKYLVAMSDFFSGDLEKYGESAREFYLEYGKE